MQKTHKEPCFFVMSYYFTNKSSVNTLRKTVLKMWKTNQLKRFIVENSVEIVKIVKSLNLSSTHFSTFRFLLYI